MTNVIEELTRHYDERTAKAALKRFFENDQFEELLQVNRIIEAHAGPNRAVALSQALVDRNLNDPSVFLVSLPRSASTFLRDSLIATWGLLNYLCYNRNDRGFTDLDGVYSRKLGFGGLIARTHSEAHPDELKKIDEAGVSRFIVLVRDPLNAAVSMMNRQGLPAESPDQSILALAVRYAEWLTLWRDWSETRRENVLVLRYEDIVLDWERALQDVAGHVGLPSRRIVLADEKSRNAYPASGDAGAKSLAKPKRDQVFAPLDGWCGYSG